jgi:hypothetical protein
MSDVEWIGSSTYHEQLHEVYGIHIRLAQYPILAPRIRELMRRALFAGGILTPAALEAEVRQKAIASQAREGLADPFGQESATVWNHRMSVIRDQLTDFYFAYNFPPERLDEVIHQGLAESATTDQQPALLDFNPELAPMDLLFAQGEAYAALPPAELARVQHHLREIVVVLIKGMLSDQLEFIGIAKEILTIEDLREVRRHLIGHGKIGGKAAGLLLARKMLCIEGPTGEQATSTTPEGEDTGRGKLACRVKIPDSYYIGADVFYDFMAVNGFSHFMDQKYRRSEEIIADYPRIRDSYRNGRFPVDIVQGLKGVLDEVGDSPLIVRSSSLLEVHFGAALAGKYESVFCANQGTPSENLETLLQAVARVYASTLSPDALLYRQQMGLVDYDERMAVLIQKVEGKRYRHYLFPTVAGVGYSRNPIRWNPKIRREDGFLRLVSGFGTRAVERVANDYPRLVALSHPKLRPFIGTDQTRKHAQRYMDVLDLNDHTIKTLPVSEVLQHDYPALRYLASMDKDGYLVPIFARLTASERGRLLLTFDRLVEDTAFIDLMKQMLSRLEEEHRWPVDVEFTVDIEPGHPHAVYTIHLLQCRPQVSRKQQAAVEIPDPIPPQDLILQTTELVPLGIVPGVRYVVCVDPQTYHRAPAHSTSVGSTVKLEIARVIGRLNEKLRDEVFILIGPGRWGSSDVDLGVKVTYADIFNARVLIEVASTDSGMGAEPSYGTHFFQDLVEAGIFPLPVPLGRRGTFLNTDFLDRAPNRLAALLPNDAEYAAYVKVIDVPAITGGRHIEVVMNDEQQRAVAYLKPLKTNSDR